MKKAVFLGLNALGDTLCTTPAIRAFRLLNPDTAIIYVTQAANFCRVLDHNPDIDLVLYNERMYFHGIPEKTNEWLCTLPIDLREGAMLYRLDLRHVCTSPDVFRQHISKAFARIVGVETQSVRPVLHLTELERRAARVFASRPYVVFSLHSVSNPERPDGKGRKKDWPAERWQELARRLHAEGEFDILLVGAERDPWIEIPHARRLYGLPIRIVAALVEQAACLVTVENGLGHLGAALDAPMAVIYSDMMPVEWAGPAEASNCQILYGDPLDLDCGAVFEAISKVAAARLVEA